MPRVPTAQSSGLGQVRSTRAAQLPQVRQSIQTNVDQFGGYQSKQLMRASESLGFAAQNAAQVEQQNAALEAQDLETQAQKESLSFFYDGDNGLLNTRGSTALGAEQSFKTFMTDLRKRYSSQVKHPLAAQMLNKTFDRMELSGSETALRHATTQRRKYASDLAGARSALAQENAALNYTDDDLFSDSLEEVKKASHTQALLDGLKPGDLAYNKKMRDAVSGTYEARIEALISTGDPASIVRASKMLEDGYDNGDINNKTLLSKRTTLNTLLPKATATLALGDIGTNISDPNTAINFVMYDLEGGDQVVQDGEGIAKYGINSAANPDLDVENLTGAQAAERYREKYWDANNIDDLPKAMRLAAFDTYVNGFDERVLGYGAAEAIEMANGDPDKLLETRLQYYQKLAESNPEKHGPNLEGWYNRIKKITAASRRGNYDMFEVGDVASQMDTATGEELIKQAKEHNDLARFSSIGINKSIMNLIDDPNTSVEDKIMVIDRADLNGKISDGFAADARRFLKSTKTTVSDARKLEAFRELDDDLSNLRVQFGGEADSIDQSDIKITSENLDAYNDFQQNVMNKLANNEITEGEAKTFLKDFSSGILKAIEGNKSDGGSIRRGIQDPYSRGFKAIDAYLKKEGRENDILAKRDLVFRFHSYLGYFDEKGNYKTTGEYESTGNYEQDEKVVLKAFDLARKDLARQKAPILDTLSGTPNALIQDGRKVSVSDSPSDIDTTRRIQTNYQIKKGRDGRSYKVYNDGRYEVIEDGQ